MIQDWLTITTISIWIAKTKLGFPRNKHGNVTYPIPKREVENGLIMSYIITYQKIPPRIELTSQPTVFKALRVIVVTYYTRSNMVYLHQLSLCLHRPLCQTPLNLSVEARMCGKSSCRTEWACGAQGDVPCRCTLCIVSPPLGRNRMMPLWTWEFCFMKHFHLCKMYGIKRFWKSQN